MKKTGVEEKEQMSLATLNPGTSARIVGVCGGHGLQRRLAAMGVVRGQEVEVVRNSGGGPIVISVMGSQLMVGRGMAQKIIVD